MKKTLLLLCYLAVALIISDRLMAYIYTPQEGSTAVIIYTTSWCPYCKVLRDTLNQYEIPFTEHDTENSISGILGFWALRAHAVPVSVIGEQVIHGYNGEIITDALVTAGYEVPLRWPDE